MEETKKAVPAPEDDPELKKLAQEAHALEEAVKAEAKTAGWQSLTHVFREPFVYERKTFETLEFDWGALTGADSMAIEDEILARTRRTVVNPRFSSEYLTAMAARACTYRNADGFRTITADALYELPLPEFRAICLAARSFLLRSGSRRATAAAGSESNA